MKMIMIGSRKKLIFIGHQYHQKTKSSEFFTIVLEKYFEIEYLWLDPTNKNLFDINLISNAPNIIVWQVLLDQNIIKLIENKNVIFIPMYDGLGAYQNSGSLRKENFKNFKNFKVINFSRYVDEQIHKNQILNTLYVQYAPVVFDSIKKAKNKEKYKLFFWQRRNEITWNELKQRIEPSQIESIHIHRAIDPNMTFVMPTQEEIIKFNITFSDWFETKEEYINKIEECDVYVAPRLYEGIGMSFLEAMALGKCVMAPNFATMNEYIVHNQNGLLYDIKNFSVLDLSNANELGFNANKTIEKIFKEWNDSEQKIIEFILKETTHQVIDSQNKIQNEKINTSIQKLCKVSFFKNPIKKYKAYKNMINVYQSEKNNCVLNENTIGKNKKILIIFPHNPFLLQNGVQTRFYELIKYLNSKNYMVDILSHTNFVDKWEEKHIYNKLINKVYFNDFKQSKVQQNISNAVLPNFAFNSLEKQLKELYNTNKYDILLMSYVHWANIVKDISNVKKFIMIEDFISMNNYERNKGQYNLGQSINEEIERINLFDKAICISKEEMSFFERACKNVEFYHIPHFLEVNFDSKIKDTDIVFVGSDNPFNKDGMIWFLEKVMPNLGDKYKIKIIGRVNEHLQKYKNRFKNIEFIKYVESLDEIYIRSKISICPLQGGTGLKIKVVESLSYGLPVVSTKYGVVGMDSKYNGCIIEDDSVRFSNAIKDTLEKEVKYKKLQNEAKEYFIENFSKESVYKKLDKVFFE